jgi:prevent-host-death family protein
MPTVGVRELKNRATQIVRAVREEQSEYVVTVGGHPVAVLRPYTAEDEDIRRQAHAGEAIALLRSIVDEVAGRAVPGASGVQSLEEERASRWES